jgi:DNA-binding transcriptional regulator YiaG
MSPSEFKQARKNLGLTQAQLGAILDTGPTAIRKWEASDNCSTARSVNPIAARTMRWMLAGFRPPEWPKPRS